MKKILGIVLAGVLLTGCMTYEKGMTQDIMIHTPGLSNVPCTLESRDHKYETIAPGAIVVARNSEDLKLTCIKAGYIDYVDNLESRAKDGTIIGSAVGGLLAGVAYDTATKAIYSYPDRVIVEMKKDPNRSRYKPKEKYVLQKKYVPEEAEPEVKEEEVREAVTNSVRK